MLASEIINTGNTFEAMNEALKEGGVANYESATLFFRPETYKREFAIKHLGIKIRNNFIVCYGLDYNGFGQRSNAGI